MKLSAFDFALPQELIAQTPMPERETSRLLFVNREKKALEHRQFLDILDIFASDDVLVFNRSKVIPARLKLGGNREIFLSEPIHKSTWECLIRPGKKFAVGTRIDFVDGSEASVTAITEDGLRVIEFNPINGDFWQFLQTCGSIPLPPYIGRAAEESDSKRYQTVYAEHPGSVAAPTAGLHFTDEIMNALRAKGVQIEFVTLHVGLGTFLPVKSENVAEHHMHAEVFELDRDTAARINEGRSAGKKVTAIGSTSLRVLESAADENGKLQAQSGKTEIFIYPPAEFKVVDHFFTNFHLPKSTLLMLVAAFASPGKPDGVEFAQKTYQTAIEEKYRFFSYGDATLWW